MIDLNLGNQTTKPTIRLLTKEQVARSIIVSSEMGSFLHLSLALETLIFYTWIELELAVCQMLIINRTKEAWIIHIIYAHTQHKIT